MKASRSIIIPSVLVIYLIAMAVLGYGNYMQGKMSAFEYWGIILLTLGIIALLYISLRRRERLRRERLDDIKKSNDKSVKND